MKPTVIEQKEGIVERNGNVRLIYDEQFTAEMKK